MYNKIYYVFYWNVFKIKGEYYGQKNEDRFIYEIIMETRDKVYKE